MRVSLFLMQKRAHTVRRAEFDAKYTTYDFRARCLPLLLLIYQWLKTKEGYDAHLHKSRSKKRHRGMIMSRQSVYFPQARVFCPAIQRISLMGLIRLVFLSSFHLSPCLWVIGCVNMASMLIFSWGWQAFSRRVIVLVRIVFLVRGNVHEMFFIVVVLS